MTKRVFDVIIDFAASIAGFMIVLVMLLVCAKVFARYFLGTGIVGVDQISGTMLVYITFLSAAWVLKRQEHVTIDMLLTALGSRTRSYAELVAFGLSAIVCLLVAYYGALETYESWQRGVRIAAEIEMPRAYAIVIIPLGSALLFVQFLREIRKKLNEIKNGGKVL